MGKKKFIDKKISTTFQLMARDSTDATFTQSDRVFVRVDNNPRPADSIFSDSPDYPNAEFDTDDGFAEGIGPLSDDVRKDITELGFMDDGYNYLFHLREIKNTGGYGSSGGYGGRYEGGGGYDNGGGGYSRDRGYGGSMDRGYGGSGRS